MKQLEVRRNEGLLFVLLVAAGGYTALLYYFGTVTGRELWDGVLGIVLGLYICSHPAANAIDWLFFGRHTLRKAFPGHTAVWWTALNVLVFAVGWFIVAVGVSHLAVTPRV